MVERGQIDSTSRRLDCLLYHAADGGNLNLKLFKLLGHSRPNIAETNSGDCVTIFFDCIKVPSLLMWDPSRRSAELSNEDKTVIDYLLEDCGGVDTRCGCSVAAHPAESTV